MELGQWLGEGSAQWTEAAQVVMAGGGPVKLDGTAAISLVIFLATWFLLHNLLLKHYLAVRARREQGMGGSRGEAEALKAEAGSKLASYEAGLASARQEAAELRVRLKAEADGEERATLERARESSARLVAENRRKIEAQVSQARVELKEEAQRLSEMMANQLLPSA